jgi:hypothetical protein
MLAASCNSPPDDAATNDESAPLQAASTFSTGSPQLLQLTVVTTPLKNGLHVEGRTNLPGDTELMLSVQRGPVLGGDKEAVKGGRFQEDIYPKQGQPIPSGTYEVEVRTPLGDLQPPNVKEQLGSNYEALSGPLLVKSEVSGGRIIDYTAKVNISGAPTLAQTSKLAKRLTANTRRIPGRHATPTLTRLSSSRALQ